MRSEADNMEVNHQKLIEIHNDLMDVLEKHNVFLEIAVDEDTLEVSIDVVEYGTRYFIGSYCSEFHDMYPSCRSRKK